MGYANGERKFFIGERTGLLGSKRKQSLEKFGYSPKNFVQLARLLWAATYFIENGVFPVKISDYNPELQEFLFSVKTEPEKHNKDDLLRLSYKYEEKLKEVFDSRNKNNDFKFDSDVANGLLLGVYKKYLTAADT